MSFMALALAFMLICFVVHHRYSYCYTDTRRGKVVFS